MCIRDRRQGFPLPLFEAWAVDGVYLNGKLLETGANPVTPPTPSGNDGWYKQNGKWLSLILIFPKIISASMWI